MNVVNSAMLGASILSMPQRPEVEPLTEYYAKAMMTKPCVGSAVKAEKINSRRRTSRGEGDRGR